MSTIVTFFFCYNTTNGGHICICCTQCISGRQTCWSRNSRNFVFIWILKMCKHSTCTVEWPGSARSVCLQPITTFRRSIPVKLTSLWKFWVTPRNVNTHKTLVRITRNQMHETWGLDQWGKSEMSIILGVRWSMTHSVLPPRLPRQTSLTAESVWGTPAGRKSGHTAPRDLNQYSITHGDQILTRKASRC